MKDLGLAMMHEKKIIESVVYERSNPNSDRTKDVTEIKGLKS